MSERIQIDALKPGMVIVQITRQNGPVKIRKSGLVSSDAMVQGLAEMGVQEVEIDPAQTVEVAEPLHHRTQTQALLRGEHDTSAKLDHTLSDQFNRSLFLPTVQSLPSMWKIYGKQVLTFMVVILGGMGIGFTAATSSLWWPAFGNHANAPAVTTAPATQDQGTDEETNANVGQDGAQENEQQSVAGTQSLSETDTRPESQPVAQDNPPPQSQTVSESTGQQASRDPQSPSGSEEPEGKVINQPEKDNVDVSPELMARFNKAVEAMDDEASQQTEPETKITVHDNMPRVDQLPVRLLTRLPTMNFSAHMYASQKEDRWVRVNGVQLMEGDWIDDRVQIVNIEAQHVVLSFEDTLFTMAALTDW